MFNGRARTASPSGGKGTMSPRPDHILPVGLLVTLIMMAIAHESYAANFMGLGTLPTAIEGSRASDVSLDGSVVVGVVLAGGTVSEAFRWTKTSGMQGLGFLPCNEGCDPFGDLGSGATAVSGDGSSIVGDASIPIKDSGGVSILVSFRWTEETGMNPLSSDGAQAVSADGSVVVFGNIPATGPTARRCVNCWTEGGTFQNLGTLPGESTSAAFDVSSDGSIVVGGSGLSAFRWTEPTSMMTSLGHLPGGEYTVASAISSEGSVIVGRSNGQAFRWTDEGGMEALGYLHTEDVYSEATDVSAGGAWIVGVSGSQLSSEVFIWDANHGMRGLGDVLIQAGLSDPLSGWDLGEATGISANGLVIIGTGTNPQGQTEAWRAVLVSQGDYNTDGTVNAADYTLWRDTLGQTGSGLAADGDGDEQVDADDYVVWKAHFGATAGSYGPQTFVSAPEPRNSTTLLAGMFAMFLQRRMQPKLIPRSVLAYIWLLRKRGHVRCQPIAVC